MEVGQQWDGGSNYWNDRISSFMVGEGVKLTLCVEYHCNNPNRGGSSEVIGQHESPQMPEIDDVVSHIILEAHNEPLVMLFKDEQCLVGYAGLFEPGFHNGNHIYDRHIGDNNTRGIRVEAGLRATIFADYDFTGIRKIINGPA